MDENLNNLGLENDIVEDAELDQNLVNDLQINKVIEKKESAKKPESNKTDNSNQKHNKKVEKTSAIYNNDSQEEKNNIDFLMDIPLAVSVEIGRARIAIKDLIQLGPSSVIELDKAIGEPLDLLVNDKLIAKGEVVIFDENFGIRITDIIKPEDRIKSLK
ncbi:flagellar motor switch protein FliN [Candidatus Gottesmanbacteria bacterium]|nr:flagellar motor switch protein FliN [Candidatus Gottesmanbacteria bacterium]